MTCESPEKTTPLRTESKSPLKELNTTTIKKEQKKKKGDLIYI